MKFFGFFNGFLTFFKKGNEQGTTESQGVANAPSRVDSLQAEIKLFQKRVRSIETRYATASALKTNRLWAQEFDTELVAPLLALLKNIKTNAPSLKDVLDDHIANVEIYEQYLQSYTRSRKFPAEVELLFKGVKKILRSVNKELSA